MSDEHAARISAIRERCVVREPEPVGPCAACGAQLDIGSSDDSGIKWACYRRGENGRVDIDHYQRSQVFRRWPPTVDPDIPYLLDRLEAAEAELEQARQWADRWKRLAQRLRFKLRNERDLAGLFAQEIQSSHQQAARGDDGAGVEQ